MASTYYIRLKGFPVMLILFSIFLYFPSKKIILFNKFADDVMNENVSKSESIYKIDTRPFIIINLNLK